jgi:predicted dehydrogenase
LVAIADVATQRVKQVAEELEIEHAYSSLEEMAQRKDIDAVVIAATDKFHAQAILIASAAGKNILCEKPLEIAAAAENSRLQGRPFKVLGEKAAH